MAWAADGAVQSLPGGPAVRQMDLAPPATQIAADVQSLHYGLLVVCLLIFIGVFGVMFYSILKHRKSLGAKPEALCQARSKVPSPGFQRLRIYFQWRRRCHHRKEFP